MARPGATRPLPAARRESEAVGWPGTSTGADERCVGKFVVRLYVLLASVPPLWLEFCR
jgi:hypothetical protein